MLLKEDVVLIVWNFFSLDERRTQRTVADICIDESRTDVNAAGILYVLWRSTLSWRDGTIFLRLAVFSGGKATVVSSAFLSHA